MTAQKLKTFDLADAVIAIAVCLLGIVGSYYINQIDARQRAQQKIDDNQTTQLNDHAFRITKNEKEIEFATRKFLQIDTKLDEVLKEIRQLRERE